MAFLDSTSYKITRNDLVVEKSPGLLNFKIVTRETKQYEWVTDGDDTGIATQDPHGLVAAGWAYSKNHAVGYGENEGRYIEIYTRTTLSYEDYP